MYKKTITYNDYNGAEHTEDFWFNLNKAELLELEMGINGGYTNYIQKIIAANDSATLIKLFKDLIALTYGEKTLDGKRFMKGEEISRAFMETEAYSNLFMELAFDADAASAFVNGIIPADLREQAQKEVLALNAANN